LPRILEAFRMAERRDVEIRVPFAIGTSGGISTTTDPATQAAQHLISVIGTSLTERVMRPSYGTSAQATLFDADDPSDQAVLASEIQEAARTWAPDLEVLRVDSRSIGTNDGRLEFAVQFRLEGQVEEVVVRSG
jgi:phage baseplate assembly protein W